MRLHPLGKAKEREKQGWKEKRGDVDEGHSARDDGRRRRRVQEIYDYHRKEGRKEEGRGARVREGGGKEKGDPRFQRGGRRLRQLGRDGTRFKRRRENVFSGRKRERKRLVGTASWRNVLLYSGRKL